MKLTRLKLFLAASTLIGLSVGMFAHTYNAEAAFGASPPWVQNDHMLPGTSFEQIVYLGRSETDVAMKATARITGNPKLMEWITIEDIDNLIMKKGQKALPMKVTVDVPKKVGLGNYKGAIYISLSPLKTDTSLGSGEVSITFGANIDVDITVIGTKIVDYKVQSITVDPLQEGDPFGVKLEVLNLGNTAISELKGQIDIYRDGETEILKTLSFIPFTDSIAANETNVRRMVYKDVILEPGKYSIVVKVFKGEEAVYDTRLVQEVTAKVVPVITPEAAIAEKPALPKTAEEIAAEKAAAEAKITEEPAVVQPIVVQIPASDLKSAAPAATSNTAYLIFGLAGLGFGLVALIGMIVVLVIVLKNQNRATIVKENNLNNTK